MCPAAGYAFFGGARGPALQDGMLNRAKRDGEDAAPYGMTGTGGGLCPPVSLVWESVSPALTKTGFVSSIKRKLFSFLRKCLV